MKLGISAFAWIGSFEQRHLELLPRVREMGYAAFEIPMFDPADLPVRSLRKAFVESGLECTICSILPSGVNPISPEPAVRKHSQAHLAKCIETAAELGASLIGGPILAPIGYFTNNRPSADEWAWAVEACQSIVGHLDAHSVSLSLEPVNRAETFFLRTIQEAVAVCSAVAHPRIGVTIDTFHANIEEGSLEKAIEITGPKLLHVHLSENTRGLLGTGHIDFGRIVAALKRAQYKANVIVEGFGFDERERNAPGYLWADQDVSPEFLAQSGYAFCQNLIGQDQK